MFQTKADDIRKCIHSSLTGECLYHTINNFEKSYQTCRVSDNNIPFFFHL